MRVSCAVQGRIRVFGDNCLQCSAPVSAREDGGEILEPPEDGDQSLCYDQDPVTGMTPLGCSAVQLVHGLCTTLQALPPYYAL